MAMSCGQEPDHSTIAPFVSNLKKEIKPLFKDVLLVYEEMAAKIDTEQARKIYPRRVEPVFANIRTQKRLDRFTLRGKIKVNIQWLLYCMVHNVEKIANFGSEFAVA